MVASFKIVLAAALVAAGTPAFASPIYSRASSSSSGKSSSSGSSLGHDAVTSAASGAVNALVTQAIQEVEKLFRRELGTQLAARASSSSSSKSSSSGSSLGHDAVTSAASGAANALVTQAIQEIEKLFRRELIPELAARASSSGKSSSSGSSLGHDAVTSAASGAANAAVTQIIQEIEKHLRRDLTLTLPNGVHLGPGIKVGGLNEPEARSIANSIVGGAASHAANYGVTHLIQGIENLFSRAFNGEISDFSDLGLGSNGKIPNFSNLGIEHPPFEIEARGIGSDVAKSAASGAANAGVTQIIQALEGLFRRDFPNDLIQGHGPEVFDPSQIASIFHDFHARGLGSGIAKSAASGAANAGLTQLIQGLESLFRRESTLDIFKPGDLSDLGLELPYGIEARGIGNDVAKSAASGAANAGVTQIIQALEGLFRRDFPADIIGHGPEVFDPSQIPDILPEFQARGLGSSVAKSAASGAANAGLTQLIQGLEGLFKRDMDLD